MPKMKTRRAAAKRFRITGTGKVIRRSSRSKHLLEWKTSKQKRKAGRDKIISKTDLGRVRVMMPYGKS